VATEIARDVAHRLVEEYSAAIVWVCTAETVALHAIKRDTHLDAAVEQT
jgi:hypothetical protein